MATRNKIIAGLNTKDLKRTGLFDELVITKNDRYHEVVVAGRPVLAYLQTEPGRFNIKYPDNNETFRGVSYRHVVTTINDALEGL